MVDALSEREARERAATSPADRFEDFLGQRSAPPSSDGHWIRIVLASAYVFRQIVYVVGIFLSVLWVRVILETLIVLFNIANSLKAIEEHSTPAT